MGVAPDEGKVAYLQTKIPLDSPVIPFDYSPVRGPVLLDSAPVEEKNAAGDPNSLNAGMENSVSPTKELAGELQQGPLTAELASKMFNGLDPRYRADPVLVATFLAVVARAETADYGHMKSLLQDVKNAQGSVDLRATGKK
jgi:hypothetical protein